jgi:predicted acylesterase/phospholipase RssA
MFAGAVPWLPSLRGSVLVAALLVGAYGVDAGLAATAILIVSYASAHALRASARASWRWLRRTRARVSDIKLLDDHKMKRFQRNALQIFDLPHHPRRLRQAVRRWRENRDAFSGDQIVRGDGLRDLHDRATDETARQKDPGSDASDPARRMSPPEKAEPSAAPDPDPSARGSVPGGLNRAGKQKSTTTTTTSTVRRALELCDLCRGLDPAQLAELERFAREVPFAAGEDVFRTRRVRADELCVVASGSVAVGDDAHADDEDELRFGNFGSEPTIISRPGAALNSLLDVLEGSQGAHERAHELREGGDREGGLAREGGPPRVADAASSRSAPTSAASAAGIARLGSALAEAAKLREGAEREQAREREQTRERERTLDPAASEGNATAPAVAPPPPLARVRVDGGGGGGGAGTPPEPCGSDPATPGARTPAHSYPATPKRAGEDEEPVGGLDSHPLRGVGDDARASAEFSGGPGGIPRLRCRGGEGGCVLVVVHLRDFHRAAGFQLGTQRAAMRLAGGFHALCHYLRAYSELEKLWVLEGSESAAAAAVRSRGEGSISTRGVVGGVARDAPGDDLGADDSPGEEDPSSRRYPSFGADGRGLDGRGLDGRGSLAASTLANLLGAETAASVDVTALDALLERRGYAPRAGTERPPPRGGYDAFDETSRASRWSDDESCAPSSRASSMSTTTTVRGGRDDRLHPAGPGSVATSVANSARGGGAPVEVEAMELAPGETIRFRSAAAAALIVERGSLEGYWNPPDAADHGARASVSGGAPTRRGSGERRESARSRRSSRGERSSRRTSGDGGYLRDDDRGDPRGAGGERGPDRDRERGSSRGRDRDRDRKSQPRRSFPKPSFVAGPGSAVGAHLLLTGQRSATILRAGPSGAVVAALPYSAVARLARADPGVHSRVAASLARRLRGSLIARAWDRCGTEWTQLEAGQSLAAATVGHAPGAHGLTGSSAHADEAYVAGARAARGRHPEGVYVVVTGCVRLREDAPETEERAKRTTRGGGGGGGGGVGSREFSSLRGGRGGNAPFPGGGYSTRGEANDADDATRAGRSVFFLGVGEAVGEDSALRPHDARDRDEYSDEYASELDDREVLRRGRLSSLNRARAVRDAQLLWIPAAGLDAVATCAPRVFASLAWRMGARAAGGAGGAAAAAGLRGGGVDFAGAQRAAGIYRASVRSSVGGASGYHPGVASSNHLLDHRADAPRTVAVVPVSEGAALALDEFCAATRRALGAMGCRARVADSASRLAEVGQAGVGPLAREATAHWLAQLERSNDVVLLKADPFPSPWCVQVAHHADCIILVAAAEDHAPGPEEGHALQSLLLGGVHGGGLAGRELVLLHGSAELTPTGTRPWLEAFSVHRHHHVARAPAHGLAPAHAARLARSLRKQSVGLVLAGGGARGFAHVGVLMALEEEGVPVDLLGGTSMGAFVGGIYAKEPTALLTRIIARRLAVHMSSAWEQLRDLTIPVVSYFSGFRMNAALEPLFRGAKIEDCWLPFFCMTLDLISCVPIVHRNGTLWRYVRASMALVGFLPPLCDRLPSSSGRRGGDKSGVQHSKHSSSSSVARAPGSNPPGRLHVLVDGGYVNNLPTDVMRAMGARVVIGVDVSGRGLPEASMRPWGDALSGFGVLVRSWLPRWLGGGPTCPTMAMMQSHLPYVTDYANAARRFGTVDVMVRPAVADIPILAFGRYAEIVRAGHEAGLRAVRAWKLANPEIVETLDDGMWRPNKQRALYEHHHRDRGGGDSREFAHREGDENGGIVRQREHKARRGRVPGNEERGGGGFAPRGLFPPEWRLDSSQGGGGSGSGGDPFADRERFERGDDHRNSESEASSVGRGGSSRSRRMPPEEDRGDGGERRGARERRGGAGGAGRRRTEQWLGQSVGRERGAFAQLGSPDQPALSRRRGYGYHSQASGLDDERYHQ